MEQIPLNFDEPVGNISMPVDQVCQNVQTRVEKITQQPAFDYDEYFMVGKSRYHFRMSSRFKNGTYKLNEKNKVKYLSFAIKDGETEYRFEVGIIDYKYKSGHIERQRFQDESIPDSIGDIVISSIRKVDNHAKGPRFTDKHGKYIRSFEYFRRILGDGISDKLMPIIGRVILKIESQRREEK